jgi:hypothetical protein
MGSNHLNCEILRSDLNQTMSKGIEGNKCEGNDWEHDCSNEGEGQPRKEHRGAARGWGKQAAMDISGMKSISAA